MNGPNGVRTRQATTESECAPKEKGASNSVKWSEIKQLVESQEYRCALTGLPLTPATASLDHVIPLSRGGEHIIANAQVIADFVNRAKGSMTNAEFIEMCVAVATLHGPKTAWQQPN
jgi:5-methylcytosine-specific restriction endonuclease McrA